MGYTHYWRGRVDSTPELLEKINAVVANAGVPLAGGYGSAETKPIIDADEIRLNGVEDDSHETFYIGFGQDTSFDFCKTARKPYDAVVVALLILLSQAEGSTLTWSSDGSSDDHEDGMVLAVQWANADVTSPGYTYEEDDEDY